MKVKKFLSSVVVLVTLFASAIPLRADTTSFSVSAGGSQYSSGVTMTSNRSQYRAVLHWFEFWGLGKDHAPTSTTVIHVRPYKVLSSGNYEKASDVVSNFTCCDKSTWGKTASLKSGYGNIGNTLCLKTNSDYSLKGYYCEIQWYFL